MTQLWLVARHEFARRVRKRGFVLSAIATPLILIIVMAASGIDNMMGPDPSSQADQLKQANRSSLTIGYVDHAGIITRIPDALDADLFRRYENEASAQMDLRAGRIDAYYVVEADYRQSGQVQRVSLRLPTGPQDANWFEELLLSNLLSSASADVRERIRSPLGAEGVEYLPLEGEAAGTARNTMLPFLVTLAVMIPLFTSGSYLLMSLAEEKGNRIVEILLVSLRPHQLLAGKLLGLGALTLVQYLVWALIGLVAAALLGRAPAALLANVRLDGPELLIALLFALGGYVLYAAVMAGIGALAPDLEGGRTWVFVLTLPMMIPIYFWSAIAQEPNGPLAIVLSLIPFSAPVAMLMRMTSTAVPAWQLGASLLLVLLAGVGTVLVMGRLFRAQTLLSGEALSLRRFLVAVRG